MPEFLPDALAGPRLHLTFLYCIARGDTAKDRPQRDIGESCFPGKERILLEHVRGAAIDTVDWKQF